MRRFVVALGWVAGAFFLVRAVAELFVLDYGDPGSYRADWGGPSLAGVLAVHCGPGLVAAVLMGRSVVRRATDRRTGSASTTSRTRP